MNHDNRRDLLRVKMLALCSKLNILFQILSKPGRSLLPSDIRILFVEILPHLLCDGHLSREVIDGVSVHVPLPVVDLRELMLPEEDHLEQQAH